MNLQQQRRTNPYPWSWEAPVGAAVALVLVLVLGVATGRALANLFAGGGWHFTSLGSLFSSIGPIWTGDAAAGLDVAPGRDAGTTALRVWIVLVEVVALTTSIAATVWGLRRWGPSRMRGMATGEEVEQLLGLARLRRNAPIIRPDLHGNAKGRR